MVAFEKPSEYLKRTDWFPNQGYIKIDENYWWLYESWELLYRWAVDNNRSELERQKLSHKIREIATDYGYTSFELDGIWILGSEGLTKASWVLLVQRAEELLGI